ncbi:hypothetical protein KSS87_011337 [Heliosperma pusillum]|nr:hypothetical protein KSS87_011337 [Heliosperma pusillum]
MSLSLIQGYSSAEDEQDNNPQHTLHHHDSFSDEDDEDDDSNKNDAVSRFPNTYTPVVPPQSSNGSLLPSALDVFTELAIVPWNLIQFLNNFLDIISLLYFPGVVVQAKAQLVGIHERVRSDVGGNAPSTAAGHPQKAIASDSAQPRYNFYYSFTVESDKHCY